MVFVKELNIHGGSNQIADTIINNNSLKSNDVDELLDLLKKLIKDIRENEDYLNVKNNTSNDVDLDKFINKDKADYRKNLNIIHDVISKIKEISSSTIHVSDNFGTLLEKSLMVINDIKGFILF